jgi:hypothetical protein
MTDEVLNPIREKSKGEVEIEFIGPVRPFFAWYNTECRPLRIGASVGHVRTTAGSIGAFVRDRMDGTTTLLSNCHVLVWENNTTADDSTLQPGPLDLGSPNDRIGQMKRFCPLSFTNSNRVDCAIGAIDPGILFDLNTVDGGRRLTGIRDKPLSRALSLYKSGEGSGTTSGTLKAFEVDGLAVDYPGGRAIFDQQIEVEGTGNSPFCRGGDSGALVIDDAGKAVGLIFGGSFGGGQNGMGYGYVNPIKTVLDTLKVDLLF